MNKIAWAFLVAIVISASGALPAMADDEALAARPPDLMDSGKLLATGGVTQLEGAGGGGLVPWALITSLRLRCTFDLGSDASDGSLTSLRCKYAIFFPP